MFVGVEIQRRKDDAGKGWYRIAPAIIREPEDATREARRFRGITAATVFAGMLIVSLIALSYIVPDPMIAPEVTIIGGITP